MPIGRVWSLRSLWLTDRTPPPPQVRPPPPASEQQSAEFCTGTRGTHWLPPAASLGEGTTQWVQDDRQNGTGQFWSARCQWLMCRGLVQLSCLPLLVLLWGVSMQWFQPIQQCDRCQAGSGTMQAQCTLAYMPQAGDATMCSGSSPVNVANVAVLQQVCNMSYMWVICVRCALNHKITFAG